MLIFLFDLPHIIIFVSVVTNLSEKAAYRRYKWPQFNTSARNVVGRGLGLCFLRNTNDNLLLPSPVEFFI